MLKVIVLSTHINLFTIICPLWFVMIETELWSENEVKDYPSQYKIIDFSSTLIKCVKLDIFYWNTWDNAGLVTRIITR